MVFDVMVIVGTRPEIIKMSPVIRAIKKDSDLNLVFVHSGQHYDYEISRLIIQELELPDPDVNFRIGSGTHAIQTSKMMTDYERIFDEYNPDVVLVEGDTNTVLAAGLSAIKLHIPLGHVEAGIRSFDRKMPEEINRQIVRICAELHFAPTERAAINLLQEGVLPDKIFITGNPIVDACLQNLRIAEAKSRILDRLGLVDANPMVTVTVHRPENVDDQRNLKKLVDILLGLRECEVVFPMHPRTRKKMNEQGITKKLENAENIHVSGPVGYIDFLRLLSKSALVLTDSGGIQEEAAILKVPCLTLRYNTERPETVEMGGNRLVGLDKELVLNYTNRILGDPEFKHKLQHLENPYGDGRAGERIVEITKSACLKGLEVESSRFMRAGSAAYKLVRVDGDLDGKSIDEICRIRKAHIAIVYDEKGKPRFPYLKTIVKKGWNLLLFGEFCANS